MGMQPQRKLRSDYYQLERQRRALRQRLYTMLDELDGRPVKRRSYQPFPYGILEKTVEVVLKSLEQRIQSLLTAIERVVRKKA
jgi:hypothetical protein